MIWQRVNSFAVRFPLAVSSAGLAIRYAIGDTIGQRVEHRTSANSTEPFVHDVKRSLAFSLFGALYGGTAGFAMYNKFYPYVFGNHRPVLTAAFDVLINCPLIYFPTFYLAKEGIYSKLNEDHRPLDQVARNALQKYKTNLKEDAISCCKVWFPLNLINFTFLPLHWRQPFISSAGLLWVFVLSLSRGNESKQIVYQVGNKNPVAQVGENLFSNGAGVCPPSL